MIAGDVATLACPVCRGALGLGDGVLRCRGCGADWPVDDGLPILVRESSVRGSDRLMRAVYNGLPSLHDPLTRLLAPIVRVPLDPRADHPYLRRIDVASLATSPQRARPLRILDVGVGTGADLPLLFAALPRALDVEVWGVDLSRGMLAHCRRRVAREGYRDVRLALADAHALPFSDASFDRVFHVGAMNSYRDPRGALAEMARVAVPGTPIVVVDEQLDPARQHGLAARALFRFLTFYDRDPRSPRALLPPGATDVIEEQASAFYYVLTFRMPPSP